MEYFVTWLKKVIRIFSGEMEFFSVVVREPRENSPSGPRVWKSWEPLVYSVVCWAYTPRIKGLSLLTRSMDKLLFSSALESNFWPWALMVNWLERGLVWHWESGRLPINLSTHSQSSALQLGKRKVAFQWDNLFITLTSLTWSCGCLRLGLGLPAASRKNMIKGANACYTIPCKNCDAAHCITIL